MEEKGIEQYFRIIWAPWRYEYIKTTVSKDKQECILCKLPKMNDEEAYIVYRGEHAYVVLNAFPYNSGHLMIVPYKHVASLEDLSMDELIEINKLVIASLKALKKAMNPEGFNIGVNIGKVAGAGIEEHVHVHVVPRWCGDSNFMPVISGYKSLPISLMETYKLLKKHWST